MGKVIHTKDGRTLMKGPDGRWMSAGGKATQSKKNKEFSQKMFEENLQRKAAKEKTFKEAADHYANRPASEMDWNALNDYIEKNGLRKDYNIMMNKRPGGQEYTKQLRVMRDLVDDHRAVEKAKAAEKAKETPKKPFRRGHAINQKTPRKAEKKPITNETREGWNAILNSKDGDKIRIQDFSSLNHKPTGTETEYTLHNGRWSSAGGHSFNNDITNAGFGSFEGTVPKITKVEGGVTKKKVPSSKSTDNKIREQAKELGLDPSMSTEQLKKAINTINNAGPMTVSTAQRRDSLDKEASKKPVEKSKSLSFEKREGYGLNPAEYKLSNGDGISPRSLNPNEGNPTNIKKLKDVPGRTSRHTDEIIVKSNYSGKEYVVTREHYKDTKTGYHRAEVVDIRRHVANKEQAPRDSENMLKEYQKAYQNQLSSSAEKRMKELEEQADKMGYEIKMTNYSAQAQKNSLASPQFELVKKTAVKKESFKAKERTDYINNISRLRNNGDKKDEDWRVVRQTLNQAPTGTVMIEKGERGSECQYKKLADGSWEYITGSYKGEKTDSKTMSMGWAGHTGYSPSIEFTTEKKMAAAKAKAQKLPKFVENAKSPATVVTKTGNQMLLDLGNSDFTAVNVRTLEKQGWKRRGTSDLTWYKNI